MRGNIRKAIRLLEEAQVAADNLKERFRETVQNISLTQTMIIECRKMDLPVDDIEDLLDKSNTYLKEGNYDNAFRYSEEAWKLAIRRKTQYFIVDAISEDVLDVESLTEEMTA